MQLLIIRHGQSTNNVAQENPGTLDRVSDPGLTDLGFEQAEALGAWLAVHGPRPDRIFSSLMRRTIQTAHPWARAIDGRIEARADLFENGGPYQGEYADLVHHSGSTRSELQAFSDRVDLPDILTEEGWWQGPTERAADSLRRAQQLANWLWSLEHECVALVIHGAIGSMLLAALLQPAVIEQVLAQPRPSSRDLGVWYRLDNTSVTLLELDQQSHQVQVDWINRIDHLTDVAHVPSRTHHPFPPAV